VASILRHAPEARWHDIDSLFSTLPERDGDPGGMARWAAHLESGMSLADVACSMLSSEEFQFSAHA